MGEKNLQHLKELLYGYDFEEVVAIGSERLFLRNCIMEAFHLTPDTALITPEMLFRGWCILKRQYQQTLEQVLVTPIARTPRGSVFGIETPICAPITFPVWDGLNGHTKGVKTLNAGIYPLIEFDTRVEPYRAVILMEQGFVTVPETIAEIRFLDVR